MKTLINYKNSQLPQRNRKSIKQLNSVDFLDFGEPKFFNHTSGGNTSKLVNARSLKGSLNSER